MENDERSQIINSLMSAISSRQKDRQDLEEAVSLLFSESSSSSSNSSSSSSEESELEQKQHIESPNFTETIEAYSNDEFKSHMRIQRSTAEYLISLYSQSEFMPETSHGRRSRIGCRKTVFMYVWYISNTVTFRQLGNLFGVPKSSAWIAVRRVSSWLISIGNEYVKWPQGAAAEESRRMFEQKNIIPGLIGCLDCTHINIKAPKISRDSYYNSKQGYSLVLQAVVDPQRKFIDITCGEPGSLHDCRVLRRSTLYTRAQRDHINLFPNGSFILGDSAYPSTSWLVTPFKDNGNLTDAQRRFNYIHSATRMTVEHAFGMLKGRFRRLLKFTEQTDLSAVTRIIMSACVLHNICIIKDDLCTDCAPEQPDEGIPENGSAENAVDISVSRRQILFSFLQEQNII